MLSTVFGRLGVLTIVIIVFGFGVFLRLYPLSSQPYWMDEGYTINAVASYADGHTNGLAAILDSGTSYECFLYCYPTAQLTRIFGEHAPVYRILAVIFGILAVGVIYMTTRLLYPWRIALLATFFMHFAYFQVAWSTQARWYTLFMLLFWSALYALLKYIQTDPSHAKRRIFYGLATVTCTILAIFAHKFGVILPGIILTTWIAVTCTASHSFSLRSIRPIHIIGLLLVVVPVVLLFHQTLLTFLTHITFHYNAAYYVSFLLRSYWGLVPFIIYALVTATKRELWFGSIFLIYLLPLVFLTNIVHYRYLFHVTPVLFILAAVGVFRIANALPATFSYRLPAVTTLAVALFFISGTGTIIPQERYWLESDDPSTLGERPSYAYTPQPDWNAAYTFITTNRAPGDTIISSQPPFTKLFLNEPGYWIYYDYLGLDDRTRYRTADNREFYVGATILDTLADLQHLTSTTHGYIVYDYMAADGRIASDILDYIESNLTLVYQKEDNSYSQVWVYRF